MKRFEIYFYSERYGKVGQWIQRQYVNGETRNDAIDTFLRVNNIPYVSALDYIDIKMLEG